MTSFTKRRKERIVRKEILVTLTAVFSVGSVIISQSRHCCATFFCLAECRDIRHHLTEYSRVSTLAVIFSFIHLWIKDFTKTENRNAAVDLYRKISGFCFQPCNIFSFIICLKFLLFYQDPCLHLFLSEMKQLQ